MKTIKRVDFGLLLTMIMFTLSVTSITTIQASSPKTDFYILSKLTNFDYLDMKGVEDVISILIIVHEWEIIDGDIE